MWLYVLAENLHMTVEQVGNISHEEFVGWLAYYKIKAEHNGNDTRRP
jgi:hypothetical protein